jgi:hypothetical protein
LVRNIWSNHEQQLVETAATHSKVSEEFLRINTQVFIKFLNWPFSNLWLAIGCTQNFFLRFALALSSKADTATDSTKSMPQLISIAHTHHKIQLQTEKKKETLAFVSPSVRRRTRNRPLRLFYRGGENTARAR